MSRPPADRETEPVLVHLDHGDAWAEFPSESSTEITRLRTDLRDQTPAELPEPVDAQFPVEGLWKSTVASEPAQALETPSSDIPEPARPTERLALPPGRADELAPEPELASAPAPLRAQTAGADEASLDERTAAATPGAERAGPRRTWSGAEGISLAALLGQHVPVHWPEAVATIEELCAVLVHQAPSAPVPTLSHVIITAIGDVHVRPGSRGSRDTATVARLLHSLLADAAPPLPLRLFVTASIASSRYESIELYSEALAEYSSPQRSELIAALCRRALETPAAARMAVTVPRRTVARHEGKTPDTRTRGRSGGIIIAAGVCAAVVGAPAAWLVSSGYLSPQTAGVAVSGVPGSPVPLVEVVQPEREPFRQVRPDPWALGSIGPFAIESVTPSASLAPSGPREDALRPVDTSRDPLPIVRPAAPSVSSDGTRPALPRTLPVPPTDRPPVRALSGIDGTAQEPAASGAETSSTRVYTSADADVRPPVLASGQPKPLPPALPGSAARTVVELLIDEHGAVQSATVVGRPQRWDEMMMLSSLKNLRYRPALKDGSPVAFRLRLEPYGP
jgi:hypothetical protein